MYCRVLKSTYIFFSKIWKLIKLLLLFLVYYPLKRKCCIWNNAHLVNIITYSTKTKFNLKSSHVTASQSNNIIYLTINRHMNEIIIKCDFLFTFLKMLEKGDCPTVTSVVLFVNTLGFHTQTHIALPINSYH